MHCGEREFREKGAIASAPSSSVLRVGFALKDVCVLVLTLPKKH